MKKKSLTPVLLCACLWYTGFAQIYPGQVELSNVPAPTWHYQEEYTYDTVVNQSAWSSLSIGLHVSFGSTDRLYFRREVPELEKTNSWSATGWKGERLNAMILLWSTDTVEQVRLQMSDLKNNAGAIISKKNGTLNKVGYVISNYPYAAKDATCGESPHKNIYLMPDRFESFERFEIPGMTVRPI